MALSNAPTPGKMRLYGGFLVRVREPRDGQALTVALSKSSGEEIH